MVFQLSAIVLALSSAFVSATPATPSKCVTYQTGILTTPEQTSSNGEFNGQYKPFAWNWWGDLSFYHQTVHPTITVEFQTCLPNYGGNNNTYMDKFGRVYIPATKQCLGVPNADTNGPYTVRAMSCPNSSAGEMTTAKSIPFNWVNSRGYISWVGSTFENKTHVQGGCALGSFGYLEDPTTREPITNKTSGEYNVKLVCTYSGATAEQGSAFWTR